MNCPACNVKLARTERFGDYCPECGGIWIEKEHFDDRDKRTFRMISPEVNLQDHACPHGRQKDGGVNRFYHNPFIRDRRNRGHLH